MAKFNMSADASPSTYQMAEALRKQQTPAEEKLWVFLRKKPLGYKFRRQHPLGPYILDFYCHRARLAIEIDGEIHKEELVAKYDADREVDIRELGISIVRFTNDEVLDDTITVVKKIIAQITNEQLDYPSLQGGQGGQKNHPSL